MNKKTILFIGSIASGKTSAANKLGQLLELFNIPAKYIDINVNHGFSYILTKLITKLLNLEYKSNYYLTIRFNSPYLFCKLINLMLLLDIIYAPFALIYKIILNKAFKKVIIIDEYYINALIEYIYFIKHLCNKKEKISNMLLNLFNSITLRQSLSIIKGTNCILVLFLTDTRKSMKYWTKREGNTPVDRTHILIRSSGSNVLGRMVSDLIGCELLSFRINNHSKDLPNALDNVIKVINSEQKYKG